MKKLPFLLGTLGGAVAGYLFSNGKLREDLAKAKDADDAAKILSKHLGKDGKKLGHEVQKFMKSKEVQEGMDKAEAFMKKNINNAKKEIAEFIDDGKTAAKKEISKAAGKAKKSVAKTATTTKKKVTKTKKAAKKKTK